MLPGPFPDDHRHDGDEPEGSGPLPAEGNGAPGGPDGEAPVDARAAAVDADEDQMPPDGAEQGLFVCLPAEELTLAGFAGGGTREVARPPLVLAPGVPEPNMTWSRRATRRRRRPNPPRMG